MDGLMMDVPLSLTHLFGRAERYHHRKSIITNTRNGLVRTTYGEWADRTRRLATVFDQLGLAPNRLVQGDRAPGFGQRHRRRHRNGRGEHRDRQGRPVHRGGSRPASPQRRLQERCGCRGEQEGAERGVQFG